MPKKKAGGKKGKAKDDAEEPEPEPQAAAAGWVCAECAQENEGSDEVCVACEEPRPAAAEPEADGGRYAGYKVGALRAEREKKARVCVFVYVCAGKDAQIVIRPVRRHALLAAPQA